MRFQFFAISFVFPLAIAMCGELGFKENPYAQSEVVANPEAFRRRVIKEAEFEGTHNLAFHQTVARWLKEDDERAKLPDVVRVKEYFSSHDLQEGTSFKARASWYGAPFHGRKMANGQVYNMYKYTCAHRTLPLGTEITVLNPATKRSTKCLVTDRGPYIDDGNNPRDLDLSYAAAIEIGSAKTGVVPVIIRIVSIPAAAG